jgi:hypothetical protein
MIEYTVYEECLAKELAEGVNGGKWDTHYTEAQKAGWIRKVQYIKEHWFDKDTK